MQIVGPGGPAFEKHGAAVRRLKQGDDAEQGGFAAPVMASDAQNFPGADVQFGKVQDGADGMGIAACGIGIGPDDVFQMEERGQGPILRRRAARPIFRTNASVTSTMPSAMLRA